MKALTVLKYVGIGILGVGFIIGVIFGVQALWNWLIPELFHGPELNFWQTVGLFFLSKILLTGVAPGPQRSHKKDWKRKCPDKFRQVPKEDLDTATAEQV
jgi:hypothetical protein